MMYLVLFVLVSTLFIGYLVHIIVKSLRSAKYLDVLIPGLILLVFVVVVYTMFTSDI